MVKTTCLNDNKISAVSRENSVYLPGETILKERYKIVEVIGVGGFGVTYKAKDNVLAADVAIKEYYPVGIANRISESVNVNLFTETQRVEFSHGKIRFLKEAQDLAKFNKNSNIVSAYDFFEENNTAYMVMEYLEGCTLKEYLESKKNMDDEMMVQVTFSVMEALETIHKAGFVHRDVSPDNIFICNDLSVKLIDFGAVKPDMRGEAKTVSVILKYAYAPIEQYSKKSEIGPWTDIYALGATMYKMLTGVEPDEATGRVVDDTIKEPIELRRDISENVNNVIMKAMAVKYTERYSCIADMRNAMLGGSENTVFHNELPEKNIRSDKKDRKKLIMMIIPGVLIIAAIIGIICVNGKSDDKEHGKEKITEYKETTESTESVAIEKNNVIGEIISTELVMEMGIGIEFEMCELCIVDEELSEIGLWIEPDDGMAIYGKYSFNRELTAEEESNAFHGGDLYQLVDGSYEMVVCDEYNWSEYSDLDGNFYFNFDDNMSSGIYKFEVCEYVGECWCTYEIIFELY